MNQTTKRVARKVIEKQIRTRVSDAVERKLEDTAVKKVKENVSAKAAVVTAKVGAVAEKADEELERARRIRRVLVKAISVFVFCRSVYQKLNLLYSLIPRLKRANEKVAAMTGIDIASFIVPSNQQNIE